MKTSIDREKLTFTFRRALRASRQDVFEAWTQPEQIAVWWDPTGSKLVECNVDVRPGGKFRFVNEGHSPPFEGVYKVIERPSKLVFEAMGAEGTVQLSEEDERTVMQVTIRCASPEHFETFMRLGVHEGTDKTFDNLVAHLERTRGTSADARLGA